MVADLLEETRRANVETAPVTQIPVNTINNKSRTQRLILKQTRRHQADIIII
jgi:hypothetical protein